MLIIHPMLHRAWDGWCRTDTPPMVTSPLVAAREPVMTEIKVDFPAPF